MDLLGHAYISIHTYVHMHTYIYKLCRSYKLNNLNSILLLSCCFNVVTWSGHATLMDLFYFVWFSVPLFFCLVLCTFGCDGFNVDRFVISSRRDTKEIYALRKYTKHNFMMLVWLSYQTSLWWRCCYCY